MEIFAKAGFVTVLSVLLLAPSAAVAEPNPASSLTAERTHGDIELDPTAYVLDGYSVHAGVNHGHWRLDLGAFALTVPELVHGNADYRVSFNGYGAKLQYFFAEKHDGAFVGLDAGHARLLAERKGSALAETDDSVSLGVHAGYRIDVVSGFYLNPWLGVSYSIGADDVTLAGKTLEAQPIIVFPAIHLGYAFK